MTLVVHADALIRGDEPALRDAAVVLDDARGVLDVGPAGEVLPRHAGAAVTRVRGVVSPWLVNAHTHIELTCLRGRVAGGHGFVPWVDKLVTTRTETSEEEVAEGIHAGVSDLHKLATAAVGEVTNSLGAVQALHDAGIAAVIFHEMFGVREDLATPRARDLLAETERARKELVSSGRIKTQRRAPSPHTLYTTHPTAVRMLLDAARDAGSRVTLHLAEHSAERSAIELGTGPSVEWLRTRLRIEDSAFFFPKRPLFDYADELGALRENTLLVHLTDARPAELARVHASGAHVVLCPRSNLFIEARLPPLLAMLELGIEPALGTDSVASNASLDVLAEARALRDRFPTVPASRLLRMATWNGARALDFPRLGRIAKGAAPGLFAIEGELAAGDDPAAFVIAHVHAPRKQLALPNPGPA